MSYTAARLSPGLAIFPQICGANTRTDSAQGGGPKTSAALVPPKPKELDSA